uniref:Uncharacterized protein n=1 Tax=Rhizophora mucronata TaxID=61149 RepID=A0A2P2QX96_RHIMU
MCWNRNCQSKFLCDFWLAENWCNKEQNGEKQWAREIASIYLLVFFLNNVSLCTNLLRSLLLFQSPNVWNG